MVVSALMLLLAVAAYIGYVAQLQTLEKLGYGTANSRGMPPEVKIAVAILALLVIVLVISYCLWMIARPAVPAVDKKWAKELLNKQLVFLGGLVVGIVIK
jgi:hypothetical protein